MVLKRVKQKGISFGYCDTNTGQRVYPEPEPDPDSMTDLGLLPEQLPPDQMAAQDADAGDAATKITCFPNLGAVNTVTRHQHAVEFTVLVETVEGGQPDVCLWHNHNGHHEWCELPLKPSKAAESVLLTGQTENDRKVTRHWGTAELSGLPKHGHVVSFTIKYKLSANSDWQWASEYSGVGDGELHYQSHDYHKHSSHDLGHFFSNISPDVKMESVRSETDDTLLYSLTAAAKPAEGEASGYSYTTLGTPNDLSRWFSLVRLWSAWLAPRQGKKKLKLDKDGVLLSFLRSDGLHVVCLAISGVEDLMTTFINDDSGNVVIKARNDRNSSGTARVLVAVADTFEVANAAVMYHARKVIFQTASTTSDAETKSLVDEIKPEWLEEWYDGLTYCTWNGLGQDLTGEKVMNALETLKKNGINITNLIIDDNWQSLSTGSSQFQRAWSDFEANPSGFPDGFKPFITDLRKKNPGIKHIAVWHAILGYWGGVDPDGKLAERYKTIEVEKQPGVASGKFTVIAAKDAKRMYDDFYSFLSECGIDSVKTDAQFFLDLLEHAPDRRALTTEYQDAWTLAHLRHFGSRAISCMSQTPSILFYEQLPTNKPRLLVRNSDDFFPDVDASHPWHIFCNAHNSLLTQHLNVLPDWDMFQTSHSWASFHGAARAVSGGPIYFTDYPGVHDTKLLHQMTATTTSGKSIILRPHVVGKSMSYYTGYDEQVIVRVGTYVGYAKTGTSILGCFNCTQRPVSEFVSLSEFLGTEEGEYVVGAFTSGQVSEPTSCSAIGASAEPVAKVELGNKGWEIISAYALRTFTMTREKKETDVKVAMMGLLGKMTGAAAVTGCDMYIEENGRLRIWTSLKALGTLGIWISTLPSLKIADSLMVLLYGKAIPASCVSISKTCDNVLEIDLERAWKENGEKSGGSNEVSLEVFLR